MYNCQAEDMRTADRIHEVFVPSIPSGLENAPMARPGKRALPIENPKSRLYEIRTRLGVSRKKVGEILKVSETHVGRLERGLTPLNPDYIDTLCGAWGIQAWEFEMLEPDNTDKALLSIARALPSHKRRELLGMAEMMARYEAQKHGPKKR